MRFTLGIAIATIFWIGTALYLPVRIAPSHAQSAQLIIEMDTTETVEYDLRNLFDDEVLWLARCVWSETRQPDEMELVAWVVRNRVHAPDYPSSFREVVLEYRQFSAFNSPFQRAALEAMDENVAVWSWFYALRVAHYVYHAPEIFNPLPGSTHFYSPTSMQPEGRVPHWAVGREPILEIGNRFRFYESVSPDETWPDLALALP